eukprot:ANDGO_03596.mRNA.1 hypothetical protein SDRG_01387
MWRSLLLAVSASKSLSKTSDGATSSISSLHSSGLSSSSPSSSSASSSSFGAGKNALSPLIILSAKAVAARKMQNEAVSPTNRGDGSTPRSLSSSVSQDAESPKNSPRALAALAGVTTFIANIKMAHRKEKHLKMKGVIAELIASNKISLSVRVGDKRKEGDDSFYSVDNLRARERVRKSVLVGEASEKWWIALRSLVPNISAVSRREYVAMFSCVYNVLLPNLSFRQRVETALEDYASDCATTNDHKLDKVAFTTCLFELADIWTDSVDANEYADFLTAMRLTWSEGGRFRTELDRIKYSFGGIRFDDEKEVEKAESTHSYGGTLADPYEVYVRQTEAGVWDLPSRTTKMTVHKRQPSRSEAVVRGEIDEDAESKKVRFTSPRKSSTEGDDRHHYMDETVAYQHYKSPKSEIFDHVEDRKYTLPSQQTLLFAGDAKSKSSKVESKPHTGTRRVKPLHRDIYGYDLVLDSRKETAAFEQDVQSALSSFPSAAGGEQITPTASPRDKKHALPAVIAADLPTVNTVSSTNSPPSRTASRRTISRAISIEMEKELAAIQPSAPPGSGRKDGRRTSNDSAVRGGSPEIPIPQYLPRTSPLPSQRIRRIRRLQEQYSPPSFHLGIH